MASFAAMTLNDGSASPVARSFLPIENRNDGTIWIYEPASQAKVAGRLIKAVLKRPKDLGERYKVDIHVVVPLVDAASPAASGYTPAAKVVDTSEARMLFWLSQRATQQDRDDLLAFSKNALAQAQITDLIAKALSVTG